MFDFIRKPALWAALDAGLLAQVSVPGNYQLKTSQDVIVLSHLRELSGKRIAEVGAGNSRVLPALAKANSCVTIEKFEGQGGGPTEQQVIDGVPNVSAFLGEMSPNLEDSSFDAVFSISVVEHVDDEGLIDFHADQLRILKPGGLFLHAIDIYVEDEPQAGSTARFNAYRDWPASDGVEPLGEIYDGECRFSSDLASNPDNVMHSWGRIAPALIGLRQRAQCVSLLVGGRKN